MCILSSKCRQRNKSPHRCDADWINGAATLYVNADQMPVSDEELLLAIAERHINAQRFKKAEEALRRILSTDRNNYTAWYQLSCVLTQSGDRSAAKTAERNADGTGPVCPQCCLLQSARIIFASNLLRV